VNRTDRSARAGRQAARRPRPAAGGRTLEPGAAALLALGGLVVAGVITASLLLGSPSTGDPAGSTGRDPTRTPNPNNVSTPPPSDRAEVRGTLLFVKAGNIWSVSGSAVRRITTSGNLSSPTWSPDGRTIYAIETRRTVGRAPYQGRDEWYTLYYPMIVRMRPDGSGRDVVKDSLYSLGRSPRHRWFTWLRQPDVSPDGRTLALVSDAPNPMRRDVTLSVLSTRGGEVRNLNLPADAPLGHGDPDWSPDGTTIAFTRYFGHGAAGEPRIGLYTLSGRRFRDLTRRGYAEPAWSPDGRYLAAVRTDARGRDVVVLDARNGTEVARLTRDGSSFAPSWSGDGRQIAYLRGEGQGIDVRLITLAEGGAVRAASDKPVTADRELDGTSRPAWHGGRAAHVPLRPASAIVASVGVQAT
jgi:Tol biopolymer transport system component